LATLDVQKSALIFAVRDIDMEVCMKIVKSTNSLPRTSLKRPQRPVRGIRRKSEFQKQLDAYLIETAEDLDDYPLRLPTNGIFWDNGYEDKRIL
jgi:hypothetical protein